LILKWINAKIKKTNGNNWLKGIKKKWRHSILNSKIKSI
jgi:hypothetical protein